MFFYDVIYSDGVRVMDSFTAENLNEAKLKAKANANKYDTAYYKVCRSYQRGQRASSGQSNWH